jgi:hypothetical protein
MGEELVKPFQPFKFDPNAELWTPPEPFEPGFTQLDSGLWVPDSYAIPEGWTTYTVPEPPSLAEVKAAVTTIPGIVKLWENQYNKAVFSGLQPNPFNTHVEVPADSIQSLDGGPLKPGSMVYYKSEAVERAHTENALADFIPDKATRQRLSGLLYIGTKVCCLNCERIHDSWNAQKNPGKRENHEPFA